MSEQTKATELEPGILHEPTCPHCGYQVPNDCPIGAGCPQCHRRLLPVPEPRAADLSELEEFIEKQATELKELRAQATELKELRAQATAIKELLEEAPVTKKLRAQIASLTAPTVPSSPSESEGGGDNG